MWQPLDGGHGAVLRLTRSVRSLARRGIRNCRPLVALGNP
jgi:hypothetical protein